MKLRRHTLKFSILTLGTCQAVLALRQTALTQRYKERSDSNRHSILNTCLPMQSELRGALGPIQCGQDSRCRIFPEIRVSEQNPLRSALGAPTSHDGAQWGPKGHPPAGSVNNQVSRPLCNARVWRSQTTQPISSACPRPPVFGTLSIPQSWWQAGEPDQPCLTAFGLLICHEPGL